MDQEELQLLENFDCIKPNWDMWTDKKSRGSKIVIVGKPGSGKSTLLKDLIRAKSDIIRVGMAMSGSESVNEFYKEFFPPVFIYDEYDEEAIAQMFYRQKLAIKHSEEEHKWLCLVVDDCADNPAIFKRKIQKTLFKNGAHFRILYILCLQFALDMPLNIRTAIDGVFLFRETNLDSLKLMYTNYAGVIPSFDLFKRLMTKYTGDHNCLFINNSIQSNNWKDCVFYYRAELVDDGWKFGSKEVKAWNDERYNPNWDDQDVAMDQALNDLIGAERTLNA